MKQFFKSVAATVVGIFAFGIIIGIFTFISLIGMLMSGDKPSLRDNSVMVMKLQGTINEQGQEDVMGQITGNSFNQLGLNEILSAIKKAKNEDKIKGIYLEPGALITDYATLQEIRKALEDFKKSGKWIIAYGDAMTQGCYYLASVANKLYINPEGSVDWHGLASQPMFLKDLYAKFGVKYTVVKVGKFKSFTEQYTEDKMSDANREQVSRYINGLWQQMLSDVAKSRGINKDSLNHYADGFVAFEDSKLLKTHKMVDGFCYYDEIKNIVKKQLGIKDTKHIRQASMSEVNVAVEDKYDGSTIAVYYCQGGITSQATKRLWWRAADCEQQRDFRPERPCQRRGRKGCSYQNQFGRRRRLCLRTDMESCEPAQQEETRGGFDGRNGCIGSILYEHGRTLHHGSAYHSDWKHRYLRSLPRHERTHHSEAGSQVRRGEDQPQQRLSGSFDGPPIHSRRAELPAGIRQPWLHAFPQTCG